MVLDKPDKCFLMLIGSDDELQTDLICGNKTLENSKEEKVLGATIDFATRLLYITKKQIANLMHQ